MKLDLKTYVKDGQLHKAKNDEVIPDDEWIVFYIKDDAFWESLQYYRYMCETMGADEEQLEAVDGLIERGLQWREAHPDRLKTPDAKGEKLLNPDTGAVDASN